MTEIKYEIIKKIGVLQPPLSFGHLPLRFASGTMSPKYDNLIV